MRCAICGHDESRVLRTVNNQRRRECCHCRHRWTTVELPVEQAAAASRARELAKQLLDALPVQG